ncbi:putative thiol-disulfide oxidoreductase DCC [Perilla frutescens var. hirtella]|nr:putative thiol-disulfide oxidoreductase DCC [Perilla frutescens var. hirtella]KAH6815640.1 putative thiol-disulfide oxidoreductase DCC [Perilla frutescens var. frutescens]
MTAALRTVAAAFRSRAAFSEPFTCRRFLSSAPPPQSLRKCASAAEALLVDAADAAPPKDEMVPLALQRRVVVYDGVCHLCHTGVKWIIRADKDKKIKFCCLQSKAAEPYMEICGVDREDVLRRFLFVEGPGSYHQGSAAALRVLSYLPLPYSALSTLMVVPNPLRDAVYDYVAKRRYGWFGKEDDCLVLKETELLERFIDWEELLERSRSQQL